VTNHTGLGVSLKISPPLPHTSPLYEEIGVEVKKIKAGFIISDHENPLSDESYRLKSTFKNFTPTTTPHSLEK